MRLRATLWSRLRQHLPGVCFVARGAATARPPIHPIPPPLRIITCGLSSSQCDLLRLALAETDGVTELTLCGPDQTTREGILGVAGKYDLMVMGEDVLALEKTALIQTVSAEYPRLPILVVVPESRSEMAGESLAEGATGYLLTSELTGARVRGAIAEVLREKKLENEVRELELDPGADHCQDRLTGLLSSGLAVEFFESEFRSAVRWRADISCLIIRISRLDNLIQSHGQAFADLIIRNAANLLGRAVRHADVLTRLFPNEFLLVLPGATLPQACQRAQQILSLLAAHQFALFPPALEVSVNIGLASRMESVAERASDLIEFARRVVRSDTAGGNRPSISVWSSKEPAAGETE